MVVAKPARDMVRRDLIAHADVEIETFGRHIHQPVEHLEANLERRVQRRQLGDGRGHDAAPEAKAGANPQQATRVAARA